MATQNESFSSSSLYTVNGSRAFLVGLDSRSGIERITVHAARSCTTRRYGPTVEKRLKAIGQPYRYRVRRHRRRSLERARSLADFVKPFRHERIIFDPTGIFERANGLVSFAGAIRARLGRCVDLILWQQRYGTVYVVLNKNHCRENDQLTRTGLAGVENTVRRTLLESCGASATDFVKKIRLGFAAPGVPVIAIDRQSHVAHANLLRTMRGNATATAMMAFLGIGAATAANADEHGQAPAVSGVNYELGFLGGARDSEGTFIAEGALTLPLGNSFGARIDGTVGSSNGDFIGGIALNLFKRDPSKGLIGLSGGFATANPSGGINGSEDFGRFGAIGELYYDQFTISGFAGGQFSGGNEVKEGFVGQLDLEWYPNDNLMLLAGIENNPESDTMGRIGIEYMPGMASIPGLSFFAEGAFGDNDFGRVYAGIRLYFGASDTLKARHRRDTFRNQLMSTRMTDTPRDDTKAPVIQQVSG